MSYYVIRTGFKRTLPVTAPIATPPQATSELHTFGLRNDSREYRSMEFHGSSGSTANYHGPVTNINTIHKGSNGTRTGPQGAANQKSNLQKLNWPAPLRILEQKKISGTSFDEISLPSRPSRLAKRRSATTAILWGGNDNAEKDVFWLSGYTGSGKSIIARTVAEHFHREKRLAASFFCGSRAETLIMEDIIPTMAYQIAREFEGTRSHLAKVLTGPSALDKDINILWDILIAEPLRSLKLGRLVMVIDGLDQCESIKHQTNLLDCLVSKSLQSNSPIKLFVSCKPTQHLRQILDGYALPATCRAVLCDCDEDRREIRSFLEDSLKGIADSRQKERTMREVRGQWPTEVALLCLAEMASGQFLFADAVVTFVSDEHYDPDDRLKAVLENISVVLNDMGINKVYRAVLKQAIARGLPENQQLLHSLLVHLLFHEYPPYQPLRLSDLALFWTIESPQAVRVLAPLRMELLVPPMGDPTGVIRFRHKSFVRYLSQLYSFSPGPLVVNAVHSGPIVRRCFQIMHGDHKTLEPDKTREIMEFAFRQSLDYCGSSIPTMHTIYNLVTLDMVLWREAWSTLPWTPCDSGYMRFQAWLEKQVPSLFVC
ncbi:hypothetical protein BDN72DRAFT_290029 [Pluteus cervinus]|uniref:Uncharacterized protein n=1 Tax=Pluteus cervinus TaxID=181527 RepID=A0ACD3AEB2_9AGAR|nr:hypothetical protein BDN72DRAFT_290029 [Pluteus cervinus]